MDNRKRQGKRRQEGKSQQDKTEKKTEKDKMGESPLMRVKTTQDGKVSKVEARHRQDRARQTSSLQDGIYTLEKDKQHKTEKDKIAQDKRTQARSGHVKTR